MKTRLLLLSSLLFSVFSFSQINIFEGFATVTTPTGWVYDGFQLSSNIASSGSYSLRGVFATSAPGSFTTANYASNGTQINFGFRSRTLTSAVAHLNVVTYSVDNGPWIQIGNPFPANNQNPWQLLNFVVPAGAAPSGSSVKFQIMSNRTATSGTLDLYFDDISIQQGLPPMSAVAEYNFDNTYTNVNGNTPFTSNSNTTFVTDRHGNATGAVNLDFTAMQATIPFLPISNSARSVSLWVKSPTAVVSDNIVFSYGTNNTNNSYGLSFGTNFIRNFGFNNDLENPFALNAGVWKHVVCTYTSTGTATIYIDGVSLTSTSKPTWNTINSVFRLGFTDNSNPSTFSIDDLKIYNYALTDAQVTSLYTNNTLSSSDFTQNNLEVAIYPNPVNDILNIDTKEEVLSVEVFALQGQKVMSSKENKINVSELPAGIYLVRIQDVNNNIATKKIIKN